MADLLPPKAIVFDWDNTLIQPQGTIRVSLEKTLEVMGHNTEFHSLPKVLQQALISASVPASTYFPEVFGDKWQEALQVYRKFYAELRPNVMVQSNYAHEALTKLKQFPDLYLAVASNKSHGWLVEEVTNVGWSNIFSTVVGVDNIRAPKPAPDLLLYAIEGADLEPSHNIWYVGDSIVDMHAASNAGFAPIWYGEEGRNVSEIAPFTDTVRCYSLLEIPNLVEGLRSQK